MLKNTGTPLVIMTVRAANDNTIDMLHTILDRDFTIYELETDYGYIVKPQIIWELLQDYPKVIFFEDNEIIRNETKELDVDVVDPVPMREKLCQ